MPKWIELWVNRIRMKFPELRVNCEYLSEIYSYRVTFYKGNQEKWEERGIYLNPNPSPSVWQNRKSFRDFVDEGIKRWLSGIDKEVKDELET